MAANRKRVSRTFYSVYVRTTDGRLYSAAGRREDAEKALKLVNRQNGFNERDGSHLGMDKVDQIFLEEDTIELPAQIFEMYGSLVRRTINSIYERESQ